MKMIITFVKDRRIEDVGWGSSHHLKSCPLVGAYAKRQHRGNQVTGVARWEYLPSYLGVTTHSFRLSF